MEQFHCPFCPIIKYSINKYLSHLEHNHEHEAGFQVFCGVDNCPNVYQIVKSFKQHLRRRHNAYFTTNYNVTDNSPIENNELIVDETDDSSRSGEIDDTVACLTPEILLNGLSDHLALFILKLQEKYALAHKVKEQIVDDVGYICRYLSDGYAHIANNNLCNKSVEKLQPLTEESIGNLIGSVRSEYMLRKYCKKNLGLVEPVEIELGVSESGKKETYSYVPILSLLKKILQVEDIYDSIKKWENNRQCSDVMTDFCHGSIYKENPEHAKFVRIHLYSDEFEVVNVLGSKKTKHKVCAFYFYIGNVEPKFRSELNNIYLCLLVRHKLIQNRYSYSQVLQRLLADLRVLYHLGIDFDVPGRGTVNMRGYLATISADNLSAHAMAGFSCCFNSGHICRSCTATASSMREKFEESAFHKRTKAIHEYHCEAWSNDPVTASKAYGITGLCAFSELTYFDLTQSFPHDIMHDFLEGVIPVVLTQLFRYLHQTKLLTIKQLNRELENFHFGKNDKKSKPVAVSMRVLKENNAIAGKAIEKFCFFRCLPFIIGQFVPENCPEWQVYTQCREIAETIFAPSVAYSWLGYLASLISDFLKDFSKVFPNSLTPKMHYLVHYPTHMAKFGPLRHVWCMRFEAKHLYFKQLSTRINNFRNIAKTLAFRHQMKLCYILNSTNLLKESEIVSGSRSVPLRSVTYQVKLQLALASDITAEQTDPDEKIWKARSLHVNKRSYSILDVLMLDLIEDEYPVFFRILNIIKFRQNWVLIGTCLAVTKYNSHLCSYMVRDMRTLIAVHPGQEIDNQRLDLYTLENGDQYITLQFRACKTANAEKQM